MDRYNDFLSKYLPKYLSNPYIDEIIINDENGNDYKLIQKNFSKEKKIKVFQNENILGPFLNKLSVLKKAKNKWISLIDSDNFADIQYFETANNYIKNNKPNDCSILLPSFARPNFNYKKFETVITKNNIKSVENIDKLMFNCLINTGNSIINKFLVDNIDISKEQEEIINTSSACDVKYFNTLLLEQFPELEMHVIKDMEYDHEVHNNSVYLQTYMKFNHTINNINNRFNYFVL